jgi:RNA polymerase sigma-70 factor (ECF subfamily)
LTVNEILSMPSWWNRVQEQSPGFERDVVDRYTQELLALARHRLPKRLQACVDPEDVLQSVYRSFFRRLSEGQFQLAGPDDLWRLLATITFRKVCNTRKYHLRDRRDARRELPQPLAPVTDENVETIPALAGDIDVLCDSLDQLLQGLPERCRAILVLRLQGESIESIAMKVERSQRTVLRVLAGVSASAERLLETS